MKIARVSIDGGVCYAQVQNDELHILQGDVFSEITKTGRVEPLSRAKLLTPVQPEKIVCLGVNYSDHAAEMKHDLPPEPLIFLKPPTALIAQGEDIIWPAMSQRVDYEAELAVIIGKTCKNLQPQEAMDFVFGFTCLNDVTARDLQSKDGQWTRGKGFDTFCPVGPWIETELNWRDASVVARLNGQVKQSGRTSQMVNDIPKQISFISQIMTLKPGDIIATGTPSGIGPMQRGDLIEIEIEGIGTLANTLR